MCALSCMRDSALILPEWQQKTITILFYLSLVLSPQIRFHSELYGLGQQPLKEKLVLLFARCCLPCYRMLKEKKKQKKKCSSVGRKLHVKNVGKSKQGLINGLFHAITLFSSASVIIILLTIYSLHCNCQLYEQWIVFRGQVDNTITAADSFWQCSRGMEFQCITFKTAGWVTHTHKNVNQLLPANQVLHSSVFVNKAVIFLITVLILSSWLIYSIENSTLTSH